jgi:hypothetical protein
MGRDELPSRTTPWLFWVCLGLGLLAMLVLPGTLLEPGSQASAFAAPVSVLIFEHSPAPTPATAPPAAPTMAPSAAIAEAVPPPPPAPLEPSPVYIVMSWCLDGVAEPATVSLKSILLADLQHGVWGEEAQSVALLCVLSPAPCA